MRTFDMIITVMASIGAIIVALFGDNDVKMTFIVFVLLWIFLEVKNIYNKL